MYSLNRTNINTRRLVNFWCHQCDIEFIPADADSPICSSCNGEFCEEVSTGTNPISLQMNLNSNRINTSENLEENVSNLASQIESTIARLRVTRTLLDQLLNFNHINEDDDDMYDPVDSNLLNMLMQSDQIKGSPPVAKEIMEKLPKKLFNKQAHGVSLPCSICQDAFNDKEEVIDLPCKHYYHCHCILPWLNQHNSCPTCRNELPTDDLDYEKMKELKKKK